MRKDIRRRAADEETTYWLSYSDMMAALLLTFVLIISFTMLQSKVQYEEKELQLSDMQAQIIAQETELDEQRQVVLEQQSIMDTQEAELALAQKDLKDKQAALALLQDQLKAQQDELAVTQRKLNSQEEELGAMQEKLDAQQVKLDNIIGVRSELIEALKEEFEGTDLSIKVDEQTGAITFDSNVLFGYGESDLTDAGKQFLSRFLPRYLDVLMQPEFSDYVAEIIIEGHTDTTGGYLYNLELSQKRALTVASYCLSDDNRILSAEDTELLRSIVTANGRSFSSPVYDENGNVDADASRRVEFLFRLKDEEMVQEMEAILGGRDAEEDNADSGE